MDKTLKKVCKCEHCGNEAEMVITCTLPDEEPVKPKTESMEGNNSVAGKLKGTGTCSHCGNEADMWIDQ